MIYDIYVHVNSKLSIMSGISRNATYLTKTNIQKYKATTKQTSKHTKKQQQKTNKKQNKKQTKLQTHK